MNRTIRRFPLVADEDSICEPSIAMALYENEDLITNIHGFYQEKDYSEFSNTVGSVGESINSKERFSDRLTIVNEDKSDAARARDEARRDLRKKRQAYLSSEMKSAPKPAFQRPVQTTSPKSVSHLPVNELSHLINNLHQDDYILAEVAPVYKEPDNSSNLKNKKNNYDFLKRSQIYNNRDYQTHKERKVAQELNLTRFEDVN